MRVGDLWSVLVCKEGRRVQLASDDIVGKTRHEAGVHTAYTRKPPCGLYISHKKALHRHISPVRSTDQYPFSSSLPLDAPVFGASWPIATH